MKKLSVLSLATLAATLFLSLASCGGNGTAPPATTGRVTLTVTWPSSRAIPEAARSIKIVAVSLQPDKGVQVGQIVVARPDGQETSLAVLDKLPSVRVRLTATAHESVFGTGPILAQGTTEIVVPESNGIDASITLNGSDGQLVLRNVTEGEIDAPCGHFSIWAELAGSSDTPNITWTQSRGTFHIEGPNEMRFLIPYGPGPVTITAKLTSNPAITTSVTVIVDELGGIFDTDTLGRLRISRPNEGTEVHPYEFGTLTHSGNSFSGTYGEGTISGTVTGTTISGTMVFQGNPTPFTGTRLCPEFP